MFAHLILSEFFRSLRRHFRIAFAEQYAATYSIIDADFQWWNTLLSISGYCANVQIAEKLVSCTWRKLWFSCWNDRAKNIGITYPAKMIEQMPNAVALYENLVFSKFDHFLPVLSIDRHF